MEGNTLTLITVFLIGIAISLTFLYFILKKL